MTQKRRNLTAYLCAAAAMLAIFAVMHLLTGVPLGEYTFQTYLLQAQAWLRGELSVDNLEYLELAVFNGKYYVSFPPVPGVPMVLYTLIFGDNVPGAQFQELYLILAAELILSELIRTKRVSLLSAVHRSVLFTLGSAMLPIAFVGAVWYEAQILAFLLGVSAVIACRRKHMTVCCLCYALAVGCRPFTALIGPALLVSYLKDGGKLKKLIPGAVIGLLIASAYGAYNYARFGNPFEFGHNYLPEFQNEPQFSPSYLLSNLRQFVLGSPVFFQDGTPFVENFGFSMFLSCPLFIVCFLRTADDLRARRMDGLKWVILATQILNVLALCMHRTIGGQQFGVRYALELMPLCLYRVCEWRELSKAERITLAAGFVINFAGGYFMHL